MNSQAHEYVAAASAYSFLRRGKFAPEQKSDKRNLLVNIVGVYTAGAKPGTAMSLWPTVLLSCGAYESLIADS